MTLDAKFLREWVQAIASRPFVEFSKNLADPTEPLITQHRQETP